MLESDRLERLAGYLAKAEQILIFTGAGISTGSGIPDFRGPNGVWTRRKPVYFEEFLASEEARIEHWDFKLESWPVFRDAQPNSIHHSVVRLERSNKVIKVVTQNVDGLHAKAGTSPERLVELHGTNSKVVCLSCRAESLPDSHFEYFRTTRKPPRCQCGGLLKPATISFGQDLNVDDMMQAQGAAKSCDLVLALGSSLSVYPAADIPLLASREGSPYIIINRGFTDHDRRREVSLRIEGDVADIFPQAVDKVLS